jgi:GTP-binding protein
VLLEKPTLVVANKRDLPDAGAGWSALQAWAKSTGIPAVAVSGLSGEGIPALREGLARLLPGASELEEPPEPAGVVVHRFDSMRDGFAVSREAGGFRVHGRRIERMAAQTDFENEESVERFQRDLGRMGIDRELRRAGISEGDPVAIGSAELEWRDAAWARR